MTPVSLFAAITPTRPGTRVGQFGREPVQVHHAVAGDGNEPRALAEIMLRRFHDAGMFDGGNPDFAFGIQRVGKMVHHRVVRLGRAAGPDDVQRMTAEERGELFARIGHGPMPPARRTGACWTGCRRFSRWPPARLRAPRASPARWRCNRSKSSAGQDTIGRQTWRVFCGACFVWSSAFTRAA